MTRFIKPRTIYLAGLGLMAIVTVDMWRRFRRSSENGEGVEVVVLGTEDAIEEVQEEIEETAAAVSAARVALIGDDLTQIKGIGPTYESRLKEAGITTYAEVAAADPDHLHEVTKATATADTNEWIAQARQLSA